MRQRAGRVVGQAAGWTNGWRFGGADQRMGGGTDSGADRWMGGGTSWMGAERAVGRAAGRAAGRTGGWHYGRGAAVRKRGWQDGQRDRGAGGASM